MTKREEILRNVKRWARKPGKADLLRHLRGERLTRAEAIKAKCYECIEGEDIRPCLVSGCSLTQYCQWNLSEQQDTEEE